MKFVNLSSVKVVPGLLVAESGDLGARFEWRGGEYVQVFAWGADVPFEVINVWDYEAGAARIEFSSQAFAARVESWIVDNRDLFER